MSSRLHGVLQRVGSFLVVLAGNLLGQLVAYLLLQFLWYRLLGPPGGDSEGSATRSTPEQNFRSVDEAAAALGILPTARAAPDSRRVVCVGTLGYRPFMQLVGCQVMRLGSTSVLKNSGG